METQLTDVRLLCEDLSQPRNRHASVPRTHATTHPRSHTTQADYAQPRGSTRSRAQPRGPTQAPRRLHIEITLVHTRLPSENASFA